MTKSFGNTTLELLRRAKILGVRAGEDHRYTAVWFVVVEDRIFVRSWSDQPSGWYRAFRKQPNGSLQVGERELRIRARPTRSARLIDAVSQAYGAKYPTPASKKWVRGFARPSRARNTLELMPR